MTSKNKVAIITGASKGIGKSIAIGLGNMNYQTVLIGRNLKDLKNTANEITKNGGPTPALFSVDITHSEKIKKTIAEVAKQLGRIDILVNNAGITRDTLLLRMKEADWDAVLAVNLKSVFNCTQAAVRFMTKQRYGRIVNIASVVGAMGNAGQANYAASKAGIMGFTKSVAREVAGRNVTVNAVAPGFIETEMTAKLSDKVREAFLVQIPLGRAGQPEDVAQLVKFLVSEDASYITGQIIHLNGGMYM